MLTIRYRFIAAMLLAAGALVAGCGTAGDTTDPAGAVDNSRPELASTSALFPQGNHPQFVTECAPSASPDSYTVGVQRFGGTDADCTPTGDRSTYALPELTADGDPLEPLRAEIFYRSRTADPETIESFPEAFSMAAGIDMTDLADDPNAGWSCGTRGAVTSTPEACGTTLRFTVQFPDCWDGVRAASATSGHVARSDTDGQCPDSHPARLPALAFSVVYEAPAPGAAIELVDHAAVVDAHFSNGWDLELLDHEVTSCLHRAVVCDTIAPERVSL